MATKSKLECAYCRTEDVSVECKSCDGEFCKKCDEKFHNHPSHPNRQKHIRKAIVSSSFVQCNCCGSENVEYFCLNCEEQHLCAPCDCKFHTRQERQGHVRKQFHHPPSLSVDDGIHCCHCHIICTVECKDCSKSFCCECDEKYHAYPNLEEHTRKELKRMCSICEGPSITVRCDECCGWYCNRCDGVRHENKLANHTRKGIKERNPKDSIVHQKEAEIQALENNFKSLQDKHQLEKVQHNTEIQTKDSLIQEHIVRERRQKEQTESVEKENRDLQEQIKTLKIQVTDKEVELQRYLPQNREGTWEEYSGGDVPVDGVVSDERYKLYVCRAEVDGEVVPGWIYPPNKVCIVLHNGREHHKSSCEVLVPNSSFEWIGCHGDEIPPRAVPGGKTKEGEVLYVGRLKDTDGDYTVGKVQPSLRGCYNLPLVSGVLTFHPNYEILVWK